MKLNIYKASAGSGKTHHLAGTYIIESFEKKSPSRSGSSLYEAFRDTMAFARILAVTFTNKAAGEMKERILREFDTLANPKGKKSPYIADLQKKYPGYTPEQIQQRARSIRTAILHNYSDFNLKTIDSFVQRIVRAFCYDININSGFTTQTDEEMVLNDLVDILLRKSDDDHSLKKQFKQMAEENVRQGLNWDFRPTIKTLAKLIFTEQFRTMELFYKDMEDSKRKEYYQLSYELIDTIYQDFRTRAADIAARAEKAFAKTCMEPASIGKNIGTLYNFFTRTIKECEIKDFEIKSTISKLYNDEGWTNARPTKIQQDYVPGLKADLMPLLEEALALIREHSTDYITALVIRKYFNAFRLLGDMAQLMPEYRRENKMMLVSDATAFLNAIVEGNDAPFIYERVGNKYDHVYIDEFQDTSLYQWNNFRPLIENTLAQGYDNMIVGDVKQAIYRFRGGDWSLLNNKVQDEIGQSGIDIHTLDINWRSRKNIVEFNDAIFQKSIDVLERFNTGELDFKLLRDIYADSYQKLPPSNPKGGKVNVAFIETSKDEDTSYEEKAMLKMAQEIDRILKTGIKARRICILVRKTREAANVVNFLMEYQKSDPANSQYTVVSADSLYIANSLTVSVMINAMKYINNHDDIIAKVEMMRAYCILGNIDIDDDTIFKAAITDGEAQKILPPDFDKIIGSYSDMPLYDLCEKIISCFHLQQHPGDQEYLRTFEDCVLTFTKTFSSDLNRFVRWWDETGHSTAIQPSDDQDAVTVMTVHKSKGLDFSVQFIPFCNWPMEESSSVFKPKYVWVKSAPNTRFSGLPVLPVEYTSTLGKTHFAESYMEEKRNMYVDALNLLYVALTRAVDELHIYCPKPAEGSAKISNVGDIIYHCIGYDEESTYGIPTIRLGDYMDDSTGELTIDTDHTLEARTYKGHDYQQFKLSGFQNSPWENKLAVKTQSSEFFIQNSPFLQERINHGLFMHNVMSQIEYMDDAPQVLQEMKYQGRITEEQLTELSRMLSEAFAIPEVNKWFSRGWKHVYTERALLTTEGNIRIPDRVVVSDTETIVIDFKFGKEHDEYRTQITEYANLLKSMKNPSHPCVKAYLYYVEDKKIVQVV